MKSGICRQVGPGELERSEFMLQINSRNKYKNNNLIKF